MLWHKQKTILIIITSLFLLSACSSGPSESIVADAIAEDYRARGYEVVDIKIGGIKKMPLNQMKYMGTPAFDVDILSVTLKKNDGSGEEMVLSDITVRVKQRSLEGNEWVVVNTEGMEVQPR